MLIVTSPELATLKLTEEPRYIHRRGHKHILVKFCRVLTHYQNAVYELVSTLFLPVILLK